MRKLRIVFWLVAIVFAAGDLASKQLVFDSFRACQPEAVEAAEQQRETLADELRQRALELRHPELARLAAEGKLDEFAQEAAKADLEPLAAVARQIDRITPHYEPDKLIPGFLHIVYARNYGGVFGIGQGATVMWLVFGAIAVCLVLVFAYREEGSPVPMQVTLGLVMSGAIGNVFDRVAFGYVRDFIEVYYWPGTAWPAFNVADIAIVVGAGGLLVYALFFAPQPTKNKG